eukprot:UN34293
MTNLKGLTKDGFAEPLPKKKTITNWSKNIPVITDNNLDNLQEEYKANMKKEFNKRHMQRLCFVKNSGVKRKQSSQTNNDEKENQNRIKRRKIQPRKNMESLIITDDTLLQENLMPKIIEPVDICEELTVDENHPPEVSF